NSAFGLHRPQRDRAGDASLGPPDRVPSRAGGRPGPGRDRAQIGVAMATTMERTTPRTASAPGPSGRAAGGLPSLVALASLAMAAVAVWRGATGDARDATAASLVAV